MEILAYLGLSFALSLAPGPTAAVLPDIAVQLPETAPDDPEDDPSGELGEELRRREELKPWHILFGSLTTGATNGTTLLGYLHFNDRYGWTGDIADSGCARGDTIVGMDFCPPGYATPHLALAISAASFYTVTFALGLLMPDPLEAAAAQGGHGDLIRIHRALRWATFGMMIAQLILGPIVTALADEPFDTRRALAVTHLAVGTATSLLMTTQGLVGSLLAF